MEAIVPVFTAAGGNRHPSAADWDEKSGLLAFGANNNVAIWNPLDEARRGISELLSGHTDVVNAVRFLRSKSRVQTLIVSGSADKTISIWGDREGSCSKFKRLKALNEHEGSINCIATLPDEDIFLSGAADATVKLWRLVWRQNEHASILDINLVQSISLTPRYFPLAVSISRLDAQSMILAIGGSKSTIQVFVSEESRFKLAASLTGHEGWIRSLDFTVEKEGQESDLLLASASQDKYIRLWRVHKGEELPAISSAANDPALGVIGRSLSNKAHRFTAGQVKYSITFEALLLGHEDWIFSASWRKCKGSRLRLLSASADNSLAIWESDPSSGVWISTDRLGEMSAQKGATTATGSAGGFWISLWSPDGKAVVSLGRTGSWRLWEYDSDADRWCAQDGSYFLSTGSDQTTRLFAEWKWGDKHSWHEFSRPQIHGYDLNCVDTIGTSRFISGADEKLLRVFDEPSAIAALLAKLAGVKSSIILGLSNKAIQVVDDHESVENGDAEDHEAIDPSSFVHKSTLDIDHPPLEDQLARHTLWPEVEKLYGHGYEISAATASHDETLIATACKASSIDHAVIRLYETKDWREVRPTLTAHSLTVAALEFSDDDQYLLSVGRDRQWALFRRSEESPTVYKLKRSNPKGHSRMILDCTWAPAGISNVFATGGRDKTLKIWRVGSHEVQCAVIHSVNCSITATAFAPCLISGRFLLAYGTENGAIELLSINSKSYELEGHRRISSRESSPLKTINQISWRPSTFESSRISDLQFVVGIDDGSVRLYSKLAS
ncbi:WD40-repeat-containing domain protein [Lineolata rhizophorae]|uniref:Elongator complex protein 2 n=1 Tax=Lineolata rhizophorae TaxID=578093 RepID=A0A6A6PFH1_9PEZI|nr:WD40-repeat-containing domain protein [Lineolata rhizophorae]